MSVDIHASQALTQQHIDTMFASAHTAHSFTGEEVTQDQLDRIYNAIKWAPTAMNIQPLRITWVRSEDARSKVVAAMNEGNKEKTAKAPVIAVLSTDPRWFEHFDLIAPWAKERQPFFEQNPQVSGAMARDNAFIQIGYFIAATRALGLAVGPMGGFDNAQIDTAFNAETGHKSLLIVNLGYPTEDAYRPRSGRHEIEFATRTV